MTPEQKEQLKRIFAEARKAPKGNYGVYSSFSNRIFDMGLSSSDGDQAFRKLAQILRV